MRIGLQARLEEINRLLLVSQGVASSLEMQDAVKPVLEAILSTVRTPSAWCYRQAFFPIRSLNCHHVLPSAR